jgi:hypothetical protein
VERRGSVGVMGVGGGMVGSYVPPAPHITCSVSHNNVFYSGTSNGFIIAVDRRTGRPLVTWQGHGGPVLKVYMI